MVKTAWKAAALALVIGVTPVMNAPSPAMAGGSFTVEISPKGKRADAWRKGLSFWSRLRERRNRARVEQRGDNNSAYVGQSGSGNSVGVFQRGSGHSATVSQEGDNNALGVFQFGKNTSTTTSQTGGQTGLIFQGGW